MRATKVTPRAVAAYSASPYRGAPARFQVLDSAAHLCVYTRELLLGPTRARPRVGDALERCPRMSKLRTSAIAAAVLLVLAHVSVVALRYGSNTASLWGDWIDTLAPLVASVICWQTSQRAGPFGRRVWRLAAFSALLTSLGQGLYTDYYDCLHAPLGTLWPSDILVFFWIVPIVMTLFLSPRDPGGSGYQWLRVFDFVQVCSLALAVELSEIYVPSLWQAAGQTMQLRALHAGMLFFGLIALSFIVRALVSHNRLERAYFG